MIKDKKLPIYIGIAILIIVAAVWLKPKQNSSNQIVRKISPSIGSIQTFITSTATVQPQNRLEIKPPINGRVDKILVQEGEEVKAGQILAWMSSTERAALLDAARAQGPEVQAYWEDVYKSTPLISPIDGEVIVSTVEPGQTITSSDVVVVLSDQLIVQAQVDETDVGKVKVGQKAAISLDAYPQIKIDGKVDHIYYESKVVNNVTIYQVDILPETVPEVFRSGMSATVNIIENSKDNVLTIPLDSVTRGKDGTYVSLVKGNGSKPVEHKVELGIADDKNVEVVSGLSPDDKILEVVKNYTLTSDSKSGTNPFMPQRRGR